MSYQGSEEGIPRQFFGAGHHLKAEEFNPISHVRQVGHMLEDSSGALLVATKGKTQTGILSLLQDLQILLQKGRDSEAILELGTNERRIQFGGSHSREGSRSKTKRLEEGAHSRDTSVCILIQKETSIQMTLSVDG
jgi:hypothetical protein